MLSLKVYLLSASLHLQIALYQQPEDLSCTIKSRIIRVISFLPNVEKFMLVFDQVQMNTRTGLPTFFNSIYVQNSLFSISAPSERHVHPFIGNDLPLVNERIEHKREWGFAPQISVNQYTSWEGK